MWSPAALGADSTSTHFTARLPSKDRLVKAKGPVMQKGQDIHRRESTNESGAPQKAAQALPEGGESAILRAAKSLSLCKIQTRLDSENTQIPTHYSIIASRSAHSVPRHWHVALRLSTAHSNKLHETRESSYKAYMAQNQKDVLPSLPSSPHDGTQANHTMGTNNPSKMKSLQT